MTGAAAQVPGAKRQGRKPGQCPKYTVGIAYVILYRNAKKTPEQIAKIFKTDVNVIKAGLRAHGVDLEKAKDKLVRERDRAIKKLELEIARLKKKSLKPAQQIQIPETVNV
jgi:hypothetical protein